MAKRWRGARTAPEPQVRYERHGECSRCGYCCSHARVIDPKGWARIEARARAYLREIGKPDLPISDRCANLIENNDGTTSCRIHASLEGSPFHGCSLWPTHPNQLRKIPNCSYTFSVVSASP
jgi:hypothetical protein